MPVPIHLFQVASSQVQVTGFKSEPVTLSLVDFTLRLEIVGAEIYFLFKIFFFLFFVWFCFVLSLCWCEPWSPSWQVSSIGASRKVLVVQSSGTFKVLTNASETALLLFCIIYTSVWKIPAKTMFSYVDYGCSSLGCRNSVLSGDLIVCFYSD